MNLDDLPADLQAFIAKRSKPRRALSRMLDRLPWRVIWFIDMHFNHLRRGQPSCVSHWYCDYTDYRTWRSTMPDEFPPGRRRKGSEA